MWKHCCSTCTMMCAYYRFSCILAGLQIRFEIAEGSFLDSDVCLIKRYGGWFSYIHWFRGNPRTDPFPRFSGPSGRIHQLPTLHHCYVCPAHNNLIIQHCMNQSKIYCRACSPLTRLLSLTTIPYMMFYQLRQNSI